MLTLRHHRSLLIALLTASFTGCAGIGSQPTTSLRPFGGLPIIQPGPRRTQSPKTQSPGLLPTPAQGIEILPQTTRNSPTRRSPTPHPTSREWPVIRPGSSLTTQPSANDHHRDRHLPVIVPRPRPGDPIASTHASSPHTPATLSGDIDISPSPASETRRTPQVELLPPPREHRFIELPPPPM